MVFTHSITRRPKFLNAGFLQEAQDLLDVALKIKDHHKNIDKTLDTTKDSQDEEDKKETTYNDTAKPISSFYKQLGAALAKPLASSIVGKWSSPNCPLEFSVTGTSIVAIGTYDVAGLGFLSAIAIAGLYAKSTDSAPIKYLVEYRGHIRGKTIVGSVIRKREGEPPKNASTLLSGATEDNPIVLMWIADSNDKIHVLERSKNNSQKFYQLSRL